MHGSPFRFALQQHFTARRSISPCSPASSSWRRIQNFSPGLPLLPERPSHPLRTADASIISTSQGCPSLWTAEPVCYIPGGRARHKSSRGDRPPYAASPTHRQNLSSASRPHFQGSGQPLRRGTVLPTVTSCLGRRLQSPAPSRACWPPRRTLQLEYSFQSIEGLPRYVYGNADGRIYHSSAKGTHIRAGQ
ncbi:hypothetical protein TYRP_018237 [Tyrophagus putrescentiae]|nr:hypothetical protein TYRP_018237 [Tyrophagus putrescentiae]